MAEVTHLAEVKRDNSLISPAQLFRKMADEYDSGERKHPHVLILTLDTADDKIEWGAFMSNIRTHQCVVVTSIANNHFASGFDEVIR